MKDIQTYFCIQSGDGGKDAKNFVAILTRMYERYIKRNNALFKTHFSPCEGKEMDSATFHFTHQYNDIFKVLKMEVGIHRLVRISPYDKQNRRHTSFIYIFFWQKEDINIVLSKEDIRIDTFRASGKGGQHVNVTDSAVRVVHIPSGITVSCQQERSQHANKKEALEELQRRVQTLMDNKDKSPVRQNSAWGQQRRSYIFSPNRMVHDHTLNKKINKIDALLDGELEIIYE